MLLVVNPLSVYTLEAIPNGELSVCENVKSCCKPPLKLFRYPDF